MRKILLALTTTTAALIAVGAVPGAAAADAPDGEWAVLGDSYTAGYFAGDQLEPRDGCLRTNGSYPVLAHAAARPDLVLRNVSCVGAETRNVWESQVPPAGTDPVAPQIEALSDRTEVVTIGLGGNSFGFGPVLTKCLALGIAVSEKPAPRARPRTARTSPAVDSGTSWNSGCSRSSPSTAPCSKPSTTPHRTPASSPSGTRSWRPRTRRRARGRNRRSSPS
ncbi:GDSL-type esterase/lipase family protein [Curtobacterium sp. ZW137]|uniref:GDSL-type esterase/lipase family protein n=1 Tax=Curtobacterium sp. ZW137 TaxID=2485104 RepID=UPI000F4BF910|nr:GDSL-type esterase/lipase family protein [Curtobacterium sp. ZW137]